MISVEFPHNNMELAILSPRLSESDLSRVADIAIQHKFAGLCVPPRFVKQSAGLLSGTGVVLSTVAGYPFGFNKTTVKAIESTVAIKDGAAEVAIVPHLPAIAGQDFEGLKQELLEIARACRAARRDIFITVILESAEYLSAGDEPTDRAIASACRAVRESGCDAVQTSAIPAAYSPLLIRTVEMFKKHADGLRIKVALATPTAVQIQEMLSAGADRVWTDDRVLSNSPAATATESE